MPVGVCAARRKQVGVADSRYIRFVAADRLVARHPRVRRIVPARLDPDCLTVYYPSLRVHRKAIAANVRGANRDFLNYSLNRVFTG